MEIKRIIDKVPGGMMLIPLLLGATIHTFAPNTAEYFGSFTKGLITGAVPILAVWTFCLGASINLKATGTVVRKASILIGAKIGIACIIAFILGQYMLPTEMLTGTFFAGFSILALVVAFDMTNAGLFSSLTSQYGSKEEAAAGALIGIESGPLFTMLILGSAGVASFHPAHLAGVVLPFLFGFMLGNLDENLRNFFAPAAKVMIPFFGFALGNSIDFSLILETGIPGVILGGSVVMISALVLIPADILLAKGNGVAGVAASSTAGSAAATPMLIAQVAPQFKDVAPAATTLIATCVVISAILVPLLTSIWAKHFAWKIDVKRKTKQDSLSLEVLEKEISSG
ncbi:MULTISPECIES: 2-keto-3-deoxygluconate permease [Acinetobacter]|uniref:2-keto-3-deoxygluconate permease n=1 Tax=Acinetobacter TaxID=469 RepID=UPI001900128D|nr:MULTISPECIES: 2-keto-3-deoxygluconate permease [Acinetobacter]MBJ8418547.1 2-keto-3-deoxygluconate permease [Acinetobacter courvalinii]MCU4639291.1 2-keto-3-deoxygluconate permease [Acinetobacter courvalinii]